MEANKAWQQAVTDFCGMVADWAGNLEIHRLAHKIDLTAPAIGKREMVRREIAEAIWEGVDGNRSGLAAERDQCDLSIDDLGRNDPIWAIADAVLKRFFTLI